MTTPRPPAFRDSINLPIAIPAWGLVTLLVSAVFTAGIMYHKMDTVIEMAKDSQVQLVTVKEKQIGGLAAVANLQSGFQSHENRITNLERMALDLRNPQSK